MNAYFLSDIHIKSADEPSAQTLLKFLRSIDKKTTHLFLLGDIFDVWVGPHQYYVNKFSDLVSEFKRIASEGVELHYFEGNHDFFLKGFWDKEVGAKVHPGPINFNLSNLKLRIEHGDQTNLGDKSYQRLRWFLRSPVLSFLIHNVNDRFVGWVGETWSPLSRKQRKPYVNEEVREITRNYAKEFASEHDCDIMIIGHTHMRDDQSYNVKGKTFRFINLGTWLSEPIAFQITEQKAEFIKI